MAGLSAAFGLFKEGILNVAVFDAGKSGFEGPWATYARMRTLRSGKKLSAPALDIPSITFEAWYKAQFGDKEWDKLYKIPTLQWMEYRRWYRKVLNIPVENQTNVLQIKPQGPNIKLELENSGEKRLVTARKVIVATGRGGWGEVVVPQLSKLSPKNTMRILGAKSTLKNSRENVSPSSVSGPQHSTQLLKRLRPEPAMCSF